MENVCASSEFSLQTFKKKFYSMKWFSPNGKVNTFACIIGKKFSRKTSGEFVRATIELMNLGIEILLT